MIHRKPGSSFICQPSYSLLSRLVKGWLEELKRNNVKVRKIYFDGYLPPSKWEVRQERLLEQSQNIRILVALDPFGTTKSHDDVFDSVKPGITVTQSTGRSIADKLPKPPFLVPAVIEALAACQDWAPLIQVVPGEADTFCARDVRQNGGIVLTSDSDLLIQDLGSDGRVSFFWNIVHDCSSGISALSTSTFSFHGINNQLGIEEVGGLPRVVFEQVNGRLGFEEAVEKAKNDTQILASLDYLTFMKEYEVDECIPADRRVLDAIVTLDPRVSEIVIQTLVMKEPGLVPDAPSKPVSRGPEALSMFLPVMIENRDLRSCWTSSTSIRELAYGVLQSLSHHRSEKIVEYRTLEPSNGHSGRELSVPGPVETIEGCTQLATTLGELRDRLPSSKTLWLAFAIMEDVESSASDERTSLSVTMLSQATSSSEDVYSYSWDLIHYTAQIQASYYSLRILKQILDAVVALKQDLPETFSELRESLISLPTIAEWPTLGDMFGLLSDFASNEALTIVTDILEIPPIDLAQVAAEGTKSKKKKRKQKQDALRNTMRRNSKRSPSLNPFAVLSQASQE
ncbi:hypothetical protein DL765_009090 [Monosporascus sp. GIB2]|nr:hypothetical protein DL765_009090 [Monosporascus sp. GIB2]